MEKVPSSLSESVNKASSAVGVDFSKKHIEASKKIKTKNKIFLADVKKIYIR